MQNLFNNNKNKTVHYLFISFLLSVMVLFSASIKASISNNAPLKVEQLTTEQGLSQITVYSITQDNLGFLWVATQDGLNRYDGHEFVHYKNDINDPTSIANNFIRTVFFDSENTLWVGTQNGLSRYDVEKDTFVNYFHDESNINSLKDNTIWTIAEDNNQDIWVATATGVHRFDKKLNLFNRINFKQFNKKIVNVKSIFQDKQNNYWFGTFDHGAFLVSSDLNFISELNGHNKWKLDIDAETTYTIKPIESKLWVGTNNGIYIINKEYEITRHISPLSSSTNSISSLNVRDITQINSQSVLLATEEGLFTLNLNNDQIIKKTIKSSLNTTKLPLIYSLFKDHTNTVWLGTKYEGLISHNPISSLFTHHFNQEGGNKKRVVDFDEDNNGNIWIATELKGIYYKPSQSTDFLETNINIKEDVSSIKITDSGSLWVLTMNSNLYEYNTSTKKLTTHSTWNDSNHNQQGMIDFIMTNDAIWFGSQNSELKKYTYKTNKIDLFKVPNQPGDTRVLVLGVNNKKEVWTYTSENKLFKFDSYSQKFTKVPTPSYSIFKEGSLNSLKETSDYIWFSSIENGVLLYNKESKEYTSFTETEGLSSNAISSLVEHDNNAWVSHNNGISKLSSKTSKITNYGRKQGAEVGDFLSHSSLKTNDGEIFFGGINGFNTFYPSEIRPDLEIITTPKNQYLSVANKRLLIQKDETETTNFLLKNLLYLDKVTLSYQQTPFTLEFVAPNSTIPSEVQYRYRLTDIDDSWIYTSADNRRATYTKLPHGSYTFLVEAINNKSGSVKSAKPLNITILPPWWFSNLAYFVYCFIFASIILFFYKQAKNKENTNKQIKESEERLKLALWGSGDEMWDWNMLTNQMYRSNIWGILNLPNSKDNNNENNNNSNIHPQDSKRVNQLLEEHKAKKTEHYEAAYRVRNNNGDWIWVLDRGKIVERAADDSPIRMTGTLKDISKIKHTEERLKLFAKCIENISDAVVVYDANFLAVDCNLSYQRITGQTRTETLGLPLMFSVYPESFLHNLKKNLVHHGSWQGEVESLRPNGTSFLIDITLDIIRDENNKISHYVGVFSDITKRKETEAELRKLANSDTLTGLPNRSFFQANQSQLVAQDVEHALLVFDLDNFKKINDSIGHQIGDVLLCKVTERIATVGNIKDTCYRLGGDEFSLIIEGTNDIHKITSIADDILTSIAEPYYIRNQEIALTCSIGIAMFPDDGSNSHELLKNADTAMYHAKDKGGDTYQFFNDSMNKQAVKRLQIENLIRHGLKEDLFSVYYQPKIDVQTGTVQGMEALVRFEAGDKGIIRPDIFIPISEETGQIIEIGELVLRKACIATKAWIDNGIFTGRIAVNLSAVQFRQPNLVKVINDVLEETKLPAKYLELEITEGTVMDSPQEAIETMLQIRKMGISLSLDDFGTGYSSLAYLKKFPLNTLKIDKAFVDDIEHSEEGRNMVATIVTIAHNLGMNVVAEGVEHQNQLDYLRSLNCEQLQGYLYSRPLNEEDFGRYLISHIITSKSTPYTPID